MIYLDNAATSFPKPESVYQALDRFARDDSLPHLGLRELVVELRRDHSRTNCIHSNAARPQLLGKTARDRHQRALRSTIGNATGPAAIAPRLRGDVHNRTAIRHQRKCRLRRGEDRPHIQLEDVIPERIIHLLHLLASHQPSNNIHEHRDGLSGVLCGRRHEAANGRRVERVNLLRKCLLACGFDLCDNLRGV